MIPAPFWRPAAANPNIWLWVTFADATAKDLSIYARTPTTTIDSAAATLIPNFFYINKTDPAGLGYQTKISYPILPAPSVIPATTAVTMEGFIKWVSSPNNTTPFELLQFIPRPLIPEFYVECGYGNTGNLKLRTAAANPASGPTGGNPLAPSGTLYHWAWVIAASNPIQRFYLNGVQVLTFNTVVRSSYTMDANAAWVIGGTTNCNGGPPDKVEVYLGETRVSAANLYPGGTSFTPPTPGNLPAVP